MKIAIAEMEYHSFHSVNVTYIFILISFSCREGPVSSGSQTIEKKCVMIFAMMIYVEDLISHIYRLERRSNYNVRTNSNFILQVSFVELS